MQEQEVTEKNVDRAHPGTLQAREGLAEDQTPQFLTTLLEADALNYCKQMLSIPFQ